MTNVKNEKIEKNVKVEKTAKTKKTTAKKSTKKNETKKHELFVEYQNFVNDNIATLKIETFNDTQIILYCNKKIVKVEFDFENTHFHVKTILNKFDNDNKFARNILTLKSMKALKSYTICHSK